MAIRYATAKPVMNAWAISAKGDNVNRLCFCLEEDRCRHNDDDDDTDNDDDKFRFL